MSTDTIESNDYGSLNYRNIHRIKVGRYEFDAWFGNSAIFMQNETDLLGYKAFEKGVRRTSSKKKIIEHAQTKKPWIEKLCFCPYCFKYTDNTSEIQRHCQGCPYKSKLPGKVMYFDGEVTIRKVKGCRHKLFCQCMCVLAKFFLDNKSIFFNLEYYDFYVIYQMMDGYLTPMGFFSQELMSWDNNILSCIMVIPCYQKHHLGTKLIDFSYKLSRFKQKISGPERPLSALGRISFLKYWCSRICICFLYGSLSTYKHVGLSLISQKLGFRVDDILMALDYMKCFYQRGHKNVYTDYYTQHMCDDTDLEPENQLYADITLITDHHYKLYIDKFRMKQWVIDHNISDKPILKEEGLVLY